MKKEQVVGNINAARLLAALGRIGYKPDSAILDMVDNAVSAEAENINILLELENSSQPGKGRPKAKLKSLTIIDDGTGMDKDGLLNALSIGSSTAKYSDTTLSKFGMGLKSASSSLGDNLKIISRIKGGKTTVGEVNFAELGDQYLIDIYDGTKQEIDVLDKHCKPSESGTAVVVGAIDQNSMPSVTDVIRKIEERAGIIYYYYLAGKSPAPRKVSISLEHSGNTTKILPFDPLFVDEINSDDPNLNETNWDGVSVKWLTQTVPVQLSTDPDGPTAQLEMTQLPHPPLTGKVTELSQAECRKRYNIEAGNYGFYIYRNGRLISWADNLEGSISSNQNLYSFRGRINLGADADDAINIDVTKSRIVLSELAWDQMKAPVTEAKKKSIAAWDRAGKLFSDNNDSTAEINTKLDEFEEDDTAADKIDESTVSPTEQKKRRARKSAITKASPLSAAEKKKAKEQGQRIQFVDYLEDNMLWERGMDAEIGLIVRISKSHRLYRDLILPNQKNEALIKAVGVLFFALAKGEYETIYNSKHEDKLVDKILKQFRESAGDRLGSYLKRLSD